MYSGFLSDFVIKETESIIEAFWKYKKHNDILIVVDDKDSFVGILTHKEIYKGYQEFDKNDLVSLIVNKNCKTVQYNENSELMYGNIRNIFADNLNINFIPILKENNVVDLFSRKRAFWLMYLEKNLLPYNVYALGLYNSALDAVRLGYKKISAIEFGVAGGNGLRMLESHAKEISRLLKIDIEVYGFDTGIGLPDKRDDYRNIPYFWKPGSYQMDVQKLNQLLNGANLIIGDINNTLKDFIQKYNPSPIAFISVDVDFYTSTVPILDFLSNISDDYILPRINIYFDDISIANDAQGGCLAIKEFNSNNENKKISPEDGTNRLKILHNFNHNMYNCNYNVDLKFELEHAPNFYI